MAVCLNKMLFVKKKKRKRLKMRTESSKRYFEPLFYIPYSWT